MPERKITYERLTQKTSSGFKVQAPSMQRLYIDAALSFTDMMVPLDQIDAKDKQLIAAKGADHEKLMVHWLNEILGLVHSQSFLCKRIVFDRFDGASIEATCWGQKYDSVQHGHINRCPPLTLPQVKMGALEGMEGGFYAKVFLAPLAP